jgi:hypothetical protein
VIQAIETRYKGYRFRSRLEARWAVFFDKLGVRWHYELEGYKLKRFGGYLPDFLIFDNSNLSDFVEIKPVIPSSDEWNKVAVLSGELDKSSVYMFCGPVGYEAKILCFSSLIDDYMKKYPLCDVNYIKPFLVSEQRWAYCWNCRKAVLVLAGDFDSEECNCCYYCSAYIEEDLQHPIEMATEAARSARFEHGETPRIFGARR